MLADKLNKLDNSAIAKSDYVLNAIASYPTQVEAAKAIGTSPRVIHEWAKQKSQPRELAVRVVQLLLFLEENGIVPPAPIDFGA